MPSTANTDQRIFVQIASYRDVDCQWTIKDLFDYAAKPERIFVGVNWQFVPEDDRDCFVEKARPEQVRAVEFHIRESKGLGWARQQAQKLWRGEEYTLQIDSHMRFERGWDEALFGLLKECRSPRPVLTTYPMGFRPPRDLVGKGWIPKPTAKAFDDNRILAFGSNTFLEAQAPPKPMIHAFLAGGFVFGPSSIIRDVPSDPGVYFTGEEVSLAVRLWTNGYDLYAPHRPVLYHDYERHGKPRHWSDDRDWVRLSNLSLARLRHLFGTERSTDPDVLRDLDRYGFGRARSLQDYERFTGISFKNRTISERAKSIYFPHLNKEEAEAASKRAPARGAMTVRNFTVTLNAPGISITVGHRPRLAYESPRLLVYDNFLAPGAFERISAWATQQDYRQTTAIVGRSGFRRSGAGLPSRSSRRVCFVAGPRRDGIEDTYPSRTALDPLLALIAHMAPEIAHLVGEGRKDWNHFSVSSLAYPREAGLALHRDDDDAHTGAFTYFASPAWNVHWGGLLMVFDKATPVRGVPAGRRESSDEFRPDWVEEDPDLAQTSEPALATCVLPRPNRIAFVRPETLRFVTPVTAAAGDRVQTTLSGLFVR